MKHVMYIISRVTIIHSFIYEYSVIKVRVEVDPELSTGTLGERWEHIMDGVPVHAVYTPCARFSQGKYVINIHSFIFLASALSWSGLRWIRRPSGEYWVRDRNALK